MLWKIIFSTAHQSSLPFFTVTSARMDHVISPKILTFWFGSIEKGTDSTPLITSLPCTDWRTLWPSGRRGRGRGTGPSTSSVGTRKLEAVILWGRLTSVKKGGAQYNGQKKHSASVKTTIPTKTKRVEILRRTILASRNQNRCLGWHRFSLQTSAFSCGATIVLSWSPTSRRLLSRDTRLFVA